MYVLCQRVCGVGGYVCVVSKAGDVQHEYVCMRVVCVWCACGVRVVCGVCVCVCVCVWAHKQVKIRTRRLCSMYPKYHPLIVAEFAAADDYKVCMYVCMYTHIYTHTDRHTQTHICIYIYTYIHMYIYTCIHIYIYTYVKIYIYTYIHICEFAEADDYKVCMYVCMYVYTYLYTHTQTDTHTLRGIC